jgi:hypothetical protein
MAGRNGLKIPTAPSLAYADAIEALGVGGQLQVGEAE